ncbi:hypothetical protein ACE2AJ_15095 [Aquihabitans daechungensis]|uniref:hypothetical protein n=1 Tax=Aquihabitans daechungensis TaxID=1052257 RepID=UPI003BA12B25
MKVVRAVVITGAVLLLLGGVVALRRATQSTHYPQDPDSTVRVVVEAKGNRVEPSHDLDELTEAHLWFCRLEIGSDPVGEVERISTDPPRYAIVLQPSLDSTDRKQYEGCLEDWTLDHHLLHVVSMTALAGTGER